MAQNPYIDALRSQQEYSQRLQQQQSQQSEQKKKKSNIGSIATAALIADSVYNDGEIRKAAIEGLESLFDSGGASNIAGASSGFIPGVTPVASSAAPGGGTLLATPSGTDFGQFAPMTPTGIQTPPSNFNYGQGILGGAQLIQGIGQLRGGNTLGGGINTVAGGLNLGAAYYGPQSTAASVLPAANIAAGLYGAYQTAKLTGAMPTGRARNTNATVSGAIAGASIGSAVPVVGTVIGAAIGAIAGFVGSEVFGSSKDKDQMKRDTVRKELSKVGFLDKGFNLSLADGSKVNIGVDGKAKKEYGVLPNGQAMHAFDLNQEDPLVQKLIPNVNPLVSVLAGGDRKLTSDFTGYLVRAAMSNAGGDYNKALANVRSFYQQLQASPKLLHQQIDKMLAENKIDATTAKIYKDDITRTTAGMKFGDEPIKIGVPQPRYPAQPKPTPPPPPSGSQNYAAEFNQRNQQANPQQQDIGAAYNNFARNFIPQQQQRSVR